MSYQPSPFLSGLTKSTAAQAASIKSGFPYHSLELPDGQVIPGLIPVEALRRRLDLLGVPASLTGARVLDIGAASGWNSFELERRGAEVTAIDYVPYEEFLLFKQRCSSSVRYLIADFERISSQDLGAYDLILFLGVLYHLRNPLLALETLCGLCRGTAYIESYVFDSHHESGEQEGGATVCEFYETTELAGQIDNWWGPSRRALTALCRAAGFTQVEFRYLDDRRAGLVCSRRPFNPSQLTTAAPFLSGAASNRSGLPQLTEKNDEYLNLYFDAPFEQLDRGNVHVRLGDYGVPVLTVDALGGWAFQTTVRLPSWATAGIHEARVATASGGWSNAVRVHVIPSSPASTVPNPFALEEKTLAIDSRWTENIVIQEATVTARRTAFGDRRVMNVTAFLRLVDIEPVLDRPAAICVNGRWFPALPVGVTPKGLLQLQLLQVLDEGSESEVSLIAALPSQQYRSREYRVTLSEN